jgi:hypothetical protein
MYVFVGNNGIVLGVDVRVAEVLVSDYFSSEYTLAVTYLT